MANKIIQKLMSIPGLKVECPNCGGEFSIKKAKLFSMYDSYPLAAQRIMNNRLQYAKDLEVNIKDRRKQLAKDRKKKPEKIAVSAQASNFGQISEQILPAFITFPYKQNECRILFKPIDYIVFTGLSAKSRVETIKFVDVKPGKGQL